MKFEGAQEVNEHAFLFVKLKDKESVVGVLQGEPVTFRVHWTGTNSEVCQGPGCPLCKKGEKSRFRFRINFLTKDEAGAPIYKVLEQGMDVYGKLKSLNDEVPLEKTVVKISRKGSGLNDTEYTIIPLPTPISEPMAKAIQALPLHDLTPEKKEEDFAQTQDEEIPF